MNFEEEVAFLIQTMRMGYEDIYRMPYSRRQRLINWKQEREREVEAKLRSSR